ncbi:hypothetical protein C7W88_04565 [Novosphingobium sp. THN1]|uniref:hypothetical protein n=1 Tax=Novosphingobium sp. THN1 TaxID=1016987 RepID=UPI000E523381|nr:hypothetical protein [Novosphingobium sp. THN1]AXU18471.1 hypothetical protein C7W88_04565 [Novosphingobium sp. THN1]
MGAMKELHIETINLEAEWQHLLAAILGQPTVGRAHVMKPDAGPSDEEEWEMMRFVPDIAFTPAATADPIAVEFKMFRWPSDWRSRIRDAISFMKTLLAKTDYTRGTVILSLEINANDREALRQFAGPDVDLWDLNDLRSIAAGNPDFLDRLEELVSETLVESYGAATLGRPADTLQGALIAAKLRATPAGKPGWQAFETACYEAIQFLFSRELHKLVPQQHSCDGLHRMDLIGRIRPERNSFWALLASDFATRYVVFEAKNYKKPIGQAEVDITSKYLFRAGLRTVAIVVAREGASAPAITASAGHLREDRKFIMVISMDDLCAMLEGADAGDPPENKLFDRMDETLMAMGR